MTAVPPLTARSYQQTRQDLHAHDHAVCTYRGPEDLHLPLGAFVRDGLERGELSVFVHSFPTEAEAWALLEKAHPGAMALRGDDLVVVSLYKDAFEGPHARIDHEHVVRVVESLIDAAEQKGRAGVRIFVDASRTYFAQQRTQEWFAFESWLGRRLHHAVGLVCAYRHDDAMREDIFPDVLRTHAYRFDAKTE